MSKTRVLPSIPQVSCDHMIHHPRFMAIDTKTQAKINSAYGLLESLLDDIDSETDHDIWNMVSNALAHMPEPEATEDDE